MAKRFSSFSGFPDQPVPESKKYTSGVHPEVKTCQQTPQSSPLDLWLLRSHLTLLLFKRDLHFLGHIKMGQLWFYEPFLLFSYNL